MNSRHLDLTSQDMVSYLGVPKASLSEVRWVEEAHKQRGCLKVNPQVMASNSAAVAFYETLGYSVEERVSMGKRLYE